jgi:hypothetical protein
MPQPQSESAGNRVVNEPSHERKRSAHQEAGNEAAEKVIGDIGGDPFLNIFSG